jgi:hypothetical protein
MFPNVFLKRFLVSATILILFQLLNATFWIGGQTYFGRIIVPRLRRDETRKIFFEVETFVLTTKSLNHFDILKERQERESDSVKSFDTRCQCLTNVFFLCRRRHRCRGQSPQKATTVFVPSKLFKAPRHSG